MKTIEQQVESEAAELKERLRFLNKLTNQEIEMEVNWFKAVSTNSCQERDRIAREEERERPDDILDDMWGVISNVAGEQNQDWTDAMYRIREKYFKYLKDTTPDTKNDV